jgi:hypothetical protein
MNIDLYSTHQEYLKKIFEYTGKLNNVLEFGMGNYSTEVLINNAEKVTSIEMQHQEWYNMMVDKFKEAKNWNSYLLLGPHEYLKLEYNEGIDLAFVDGHGETRPECINLMVEKNCPIIVSHDTEASMYGWDRVKAEGYNKIDFKKHPNWTTLWTKDQGLYEFIKDIS